MALVLGTNCGFVTVAPSADPEGTGEIIDAYADSIHDTSPATAAKITEIGWYCTNTTEEANFEVGVYTDEGNDEPETRLHVDATNAKGGDAGWKSVVVDWEISPSTVYWLAMQLDDTPTSTRNDIAASGGTGEAYKASSDLPADWGSSSGNDIDGMSSIYAVWEAAAGPPAGQPYFKRFGGIPHTTTYRRW